jgi:NADH:ubiquinone oxidoreductase subunit 6 (subunit J)
MNISLLLFYLFVAVAGSSAFGILLIRNVFKAALLLLVCLLSLAALYVMALAEFVAVTQIMIYAGGILVVIIFGIMLTSKISGKTLIAGHTNVFGGLLIGVLIAGSLCILIAKNFSGDIISKTNYNTITETGNQLMTSYLLPFEIAGLLLLIALIGAAVIASSAKSKSQQ